MRSRQNHKLFTVYSTTVTTLTYFSYVIHAMTSSVTHVPALYAYLENIELFFSTDNPLFEKLVLGRFIMDAMPWKFKAEQILIQNVIPRTQRKPENSVLQRNETHDVKLVVAVIP